MITIIISVITDICYQGLLLAAIDLFRALYKREVCLVHVVHLTDVKLYQVRATCPSDLKRELLLRPVIVHQKLSKGGGLPAIAKP